MKRSFITSTALAGMLLVSVQAQAQNTIDNAAAENQNSDGIGEIVVTAQRRAEALQDVPLSVTAVDSSMLAASNITSSIDIKFAVPSVDVPITNGYATPFIRGLGSRAVGPGVESPVATYVDGVYIGSAAAALLSFNNIARVEVLKGPQGTLFGRNATGGLIQVVTRDPKPEFSGELNIGYGNYDTWRGDAYLTVPVAANVSADLAAYGVFQGDGYGTNLFNGQDVYKANHDWGVRSKWLFEPADGVEIRIAADYASLKTSSSVQRMALGTTAPPPYGPAYGGGPWDTDLSIQPLLRHEQGGVSARVDLDLGAFSLVSTTAFRKALYRNLFDADITATEGRSVYVRQLDKQFSQEVQLLSNPGTDIQWLLGLFYWNASGKYDPSIVTLNGVARPPTFSQIITLGTQKTQSIAPYAQATVKVLPNTNLTLGLRYTYEKRDHEGSVRNLTPAGTIFGSVLTADRSINASKATWRVAIDHQFSDDIMMYISQNRGFKSGGYAISNITPAYQPETLDAYELGLKTMLFNRRLRFNAAAFYYDYRDVQVLGNSGGQLFISNGGKAQVKGLEFDLTIKPTRDFLINAGYTYLDTEWKKFDGAQINTPNPAGGKRQIFGSAAGNKLPLAPTHSLSVSGTYTVPLGDNSLVLNGSYYYSSGYWGEPDNVARQPSYSLVNGSVRFITMNDHLSVTFWGKNLTDKAVNIYPSHNAVGGGLSIERATYAPPRTYGVTLGAKF